MHYPPILRGGHLQFNSSTITIQVTHQLALSTSYPSALSFLRRFLILRAAFPGKVVNFLGTPRRGISKMNPKGCFVRIHEILIESRESKLTCKVAIFRNRIFKYLSSFGCNVNPGMRGWMKFHPSLAQFLLLKFE